MDISRASACTYDLRKKDVEYALHVIAGSGFKKVDLWGGMPHFSIDESEYSIDRLMEIANSYGLQIANIGTYCGRRFSSDSREEIQRELQDTKTTIDIANRLGARSIRVVPGSGEREVLDKIVPYFREAAEYAELKGVYMGFENHGGGISGDPDACAELSEKVGSKYFGVLYEPCNLMHGGVDYKEALARFHQYVTHVHLKDGAQQEDGKFRSTMLGGGVIDAKWVVENLNKAGYTGDFALEYEVSHIEPVETGLRKWFDYYKSLQ
jgi:sugar phosphate isomerase/epimerase